MRWDAAPLAPLKNENNSLYLALPHKVWACMNNGYHRHLSKASVVYAT